MTNKMVILVIPLLKYYFGASAIRDEYLLSSIRTDIYGTTFSKLRWYQCTVLMSILYESVTYRTNATSIDSIQYLVPNFSIFDIGMILMSSLTVIYIFDGYR